MKKSIIILVIILIITMGLIIINQSFALKDEKVDNWNIYFNNLKTSIINGSAFVPNEPEIESTSVMSYDVLISKRGDSAIFTFDVINDGNVDAKLDKLIKFDPKCVSLEIPENIEDESLVCNNLDYTLTYTKNNIKVMESDIIKAGSKENLTLKVGYKENAIKEPTGDVQITLFDMRLVYSHS